MMPIFKKLSLMLCILLPWSATASASSVLTFDGLFDGPNIRNEPMVQGHAGFTWSGWRVESYEQSLGEANPDIKVPPNADGSVNIFYLTNFRSFGSVARTVTLTHSKPFYLDNLDIYTFPDNGAPVTDPADARDFFSSAQFVSITGFLGDAGSGPAVVADMGVPLLNNDGSLPGFPLHLQFRGNRDALAWNQPLDRLEITLPGGQNLANPRFVMDNLAVTFVPAPPALILLGSALVGLAAARRRRGLVPCPARMFQFSLVRVTPCGVARRRHSGAMPPPLALPDATRPARLNEHPYGTGH